MSSFPEKKYDVVAIGAIVIDVSTTAEDHHLEKHALAKGLSTPVAPETLAALMSGREDLVRTPGGPATNVAAGISLRGGASALIGKTVGDEHGIFFAERVQAHGIDYMPLFSVHENAATTCVLVMTTPDKERTFAFAGDASLHLTPEDVDRMLLDQAKITYVDSYLWNSASGRDTVHHAAAEARKSGSKLAIALNGAHIVAQHQEKFMALAQSHADILLGDEREFKALFNTQTLEETFAAVTALGCIASITVGAKGAYVIENGIVSHIPAKKVDRIIDTNGAGDQFAAGFLYGLAQGKSAAESGYIGAAWAADIIQHRGAEPQVGKNAPPAASTLKKPPPHL